MLELLNYATTDRINDHTSNPNLSPSISRIFPSSSNSNLNVGHLLAEEQMMDFRTTLPSFLEMMLIQSTQKSFKYTLETSLQSISDSLRNYCEETLRGATMAQRNRQEQEQVIGVANDSVSSSSSKSSSSSLLNGLKRYYQNVLYRIQVSVLEGNIVLAKWMLKYKTEIKYLILYMMERQFLSLRFFSSNNNELNIGSRGGGIKDTKNTKNNTGTRSHYDKNNNSQSSVPHPTSTSSGAPGPPTTTGGSRGKAKPTGRPDSTFAESMYGVMRSKVTPLNITSTSTNNNNNKKNNKSKVAVILPLKKIHKHQLALSITLIPYIKEKLDEFYETELQRKEEELNYASIQRSNTNNTNQNIFSSLSSLQSSTTTTKSVKIPSTTTPIKELYLSVYPYFHTLYDGIYLYYHYSYLFGKSIYFSPISAFLGIMSRRITMADITHHQQKNKQHQKRKKQDSSSTSNKLKSNNNTIASKSISPSSNRSPLSNNNNNMSSSSSSPSSGSIVRSMAKITKTALIVGISSFYLVSCLIRLRNYFQYTRRRYNNRTRTMIANNNNNVISNNNSSSLERGEEEGESQHQTTTTTTTNRSTNIFSPLNNNNINNNNKNKIPPPKPPLPLSFIQKVTNNHCGSCPLCNQIPIINPTASVSGFVFCFSCLSTYLTQNNNLCPMTNQYCPHEKIVRIYKTK